MTNTDRSVNRLAALSPAADLVAFAQRRADDMAREQRIYHTPNLGAQIGNWKRLGENVGRGRSLEDIESSFMSSAPHRDNILGPDYTQIGVGTARNGDLIYVAVLFRLPQNAPAPAPAPTPPPPPAPKPAVVATPRPAQVQAAPTTAPPPTTTTTEAPPSAPPVVEAPVVEAPPAVETPPPPPPDPLIDGFGLEALGAMPTSEVLGTTQAAGVIPMVKEPDLGRPLAVGTAMVAIGYVGTMIIEEYRRRLAAARELA